MLSINTLYWLDHVGSEIMEREDDSTTVMGKRRLLRDGILDEMIERLRQIDRQNWTLENMAVPTPIAIIKLFEMNRLILRDLEKQLEDVKSKNEMDWYQKLLPLAHHLQEGLRNTFDGVEEEWELFIKKNDTDDPCQNE